jgi:SAM-dependent methyltransferase
MSRWITVRVGLLLVAILPTVGQAQTPATSPQREQELEREAYQRVSDIFDAMRLRAGAVVADVGAGGGFLTVRLARTVGAGGRVFAVDIEPAALERLRARVQQENLTNVEVVQGEKEDPRLASGSLDAAVIVNAYHEMPAYQRMLGQLRRALKPEGRLVIVEPIAEKRRHESRDAQMRDHEIALHFVEDDVRDAGFRIARTEDPFTARGEWLLVAVPDPNAPTATVSASVSPDPAASPAKTLERAGSADELTNPDLRIAFDQFKQLRDEGRIIVVDVRTTAEYRSAHIPGAVSMPLDTVDTQVERLRGLGQAIVTYCS